MKRKQIIARRNRLLKLLGRSAADEAVAIKAEIHRLGAKLGIKHV